MTSVVVNIVSNMEAFFSPLSHVTLRISVLYVPWRSELVCAVINVPSPPLYLLQQSWYIFQHTGELCISQLSNTVLEKEHFLYRSHWSHVWVEYQQCAMKPVTNWRLNSFQWRAVTHIFRLNIKILEISKKIDVYSYRSAHRHVCCSSGALCRGCGAEMCNIQPSDILKMSCAPLKYEEFFTAFTLLA
jgi:hypothetical protein